MENHDSSNNPYGVPVPPWYRGYVEAIGNRNPVEVLRENLISTVALFQGMDSKLHDYAYAEGKWTVKEVLLHMIDAERVFAFRALCFARNDQTPLPGFDENSYVPNSGAAGRTMSSLIGEYTAVRKATLALFDNLSPEMWKRTGMANNYLFSVSLSALVMAGHELHHLKVLRERYLS